MKSTTRIFYDHAGRVTETIGPFFRSGYGFFEGSRPSSAPYEDITDFDFLNRPLTIVRAHDSGTATTEISYSGFNRTITDPENKTTTERRDFMGRIQSIVDADNRTTDYNYNGAGDLTYVQDALGNVTELHRNWLGHLTQLEDPDLGVWDYTYWPNGEVRTRQDSKTPRQTITYTYDNRNRIASKTYTNETPDAPDVVYTYDDAVNGNGLPYTVTKGNVTTTYGAYDDMGRVTAKTITIDGQNFAFSYAYDAAGNMNRIEYPDGYTLHYSHHNGSNLIERAWDDNLLVDVDIDQYSNFGKPGQFTYPAMTTTIDYYDRTGRIDEINVPGLLSLDYTYDRVGNVSDIVDSIRGYDYAYTYDDLHRLETESVIGRFGAPAARDIYLHYEATEPHAVSRVVEDGQEYSLIYEDNGNLTLGYDFSIPGQFAEREIAYDVENMPVSLSYTPNGGNTATTTFTYDGDGRRVKKESGGNTVIYVDNTYEIRNGQPVKYIFAGNLRLARVQGATVNYYHKDHLGSATVVTDPSGNLLESNQYEPYGQQRESCEAKLGDVAYTFTDQEWDAESGLYNYDARLYDAVLGRFVSADSVVQDWYNPQMLDRYAYVTNNPLAYIDPTGHYRSPEYLRAMVPGQISWDNAWTAIENRRYGRATLHFASMVTEQVATVLTLGATYAEMKAAETTGKAAYVTTKEILAKATRAPISGKAPKSGSFIKGAEKELRTFLKNNAGQPKEVIISAHPQIVDFRVHQEVKNYSRSSSQSNFVLHRIKLQKIFNTGIIKAHLYRLKLKQARYCSRHVAGLALALAMVSKLAATMDDQT